MDPVGNILGQMLEEQDYIDRRCHQCNKRKSRADVDLCYVCAKKKAKLAGYNLGYNEYKFGR